MADEDIDSLPSITPERDEIADRQGMRLSARRTRETEHVTSPVDSAEVAVAGPDRMLVPVVILACLLAVAIGWVVYLQIHLARAEAGVVSAASRLEQIESKLVSTDTTITKSEITLAAKIKSMDIAIDTSKADIRKLTASLDQGHRILDAHATSLQKQQGDIQSLQGLSKQTAELAATHSEQLKIVDATGKENNQRLEILQESLNEQIDKIKALTDKQTRLDSDLGKRVLSLEDNAKSNDVFRRNTNDELAHIKDMLTRPAPAK